MYSSSSLFILLLHFRPACGPCLLQSRHSEMLPSGGPVPSVLLLLSSPSVGCPELNLRGVMYSSAAEYVHTVGRKGPPRGPQVLRHLESGTNEQKKGLKHRESAQKRFENFFLTIYHVHAGFTVKNQVATLAGLCRNSNVNSIQKKKVATLSPVKRSDTISNSSRPGS